MNRFQTIEVTHLVQSRLDLHPDLDCPYLPLSHSESTAEDGISNQRAADR